MSSGLRGRPGFRFLTGGLGEVPLTHRAKLRGETIVMRSLMADPSLDPSLTRRRRSRAVTVIRVGSLPRRMRFSARRYSTMRASWESVAAASSAKSGLRSRMVGRAWGTSRDSRPVRGEDRVFVHRREAGRRGRFGHATGVRWAYRTRGAGSAPGTGCTGRVEVHGAAGCDGRE